MSIIICDHCDAYIDSDFDCECFIENPYNSKDTTVLCEPCRERAWDRQQEQNASEPPPSLDELHRAAWAQKQSLK